MLTHHDLPFLLSLFQLVLQRLGVEAQASVRHDLLACVTRNSNPDSHLHRVDTTVERQQVMLQVYDLNIGFRERSTNSVFLVEVVRAWRLTRRYMHVLAFEIRQGVHARILVS